ncbi:hypothetical protein GIB67_017615 [Kingdonia uniflora]|uniref:Uncharacterized protein n=1 Tax=Kingdonia uniflora TaxID=39325 RepID=A0A7J7LMY3_9MAGN|nr:hypothetical protein GIB67_017615 [Kingdonia uniflora]
MYEHIASIVILQLAVRYIKFDTFTPAVERGLPVTRVIGRMNLQQILAESVGEESIMNESNVVNFEDNGNKVTAILENGQRYEGDLLVGADGIWSKVRKNLFGPKDASYAGYTCYTGIADFVPPDIESVGGVGRTIASHEPHEGFRFGGTARPLEEERSGFGKLMNPMRNLRIDFKIKILVFDGSVDAEKLDNGSLSWKEFKVLVRKQFYPIGYGQERWYKWHNLHQKFEQSVQEYTTAFHNQALVLDIDVDEYEVFMKYTGADFGYRGGDSGRTFSCQYSGEAIQVKQSLVEAIVDPGSQKILIFEALVKKKGLTTTAHHKPYGLGWIQKDADLMITKQCTFKFAITERTRKYRLMKKGNKFHINACKEHVTTNNIVTATQLKRLVNASGKFVLLVQLVQEGTSARVLSTMTTSYKQQTDMGKLQEEVVVHSDHKCKDERKIEFTGMDIIDTQSCIYTTL